MKNQSKIVSLVLTMVLCLALLVGCVEGSTPQTDNPKVDSATSIFDGDCGITASAEIGNNIINFPELRITITNTTDKEIAAIKFYAVPLDVYGEEIKGWSTQKNLYTDTPITAGKTTTISYQLIEQSVKTVKLYVYSVYFSDGTEWGDKDATSSKILKGAPIIQTDNPEVDSATSIFDGDCGITASAEIGNNIINFPQLKITITNTTDKEIAAIKFYAVPLDVYGEEIKGWSTQKNLYTDTPIPAGKTITISYQLIEQSVKTVKLYVYSVYFLDGTEWGDKDATSSTIINSAPTIDVTVNS